VFSHDTFTAIFGAVRPGELEPLAGLIRAALRQGYALVLNEPGTKKPMCPLTATARRKADREVQDTALAAGDPRASQLRHPCGVNHALTEDDASKVTALLKRLTVTEEPPAATENLHLVEDRCPDTAGHDPHAWEVSTRVWHRCPGAPTTRTPNIGVEPGASRMLVVDVDTPAERDAFLATWSAETGEDQAHRGYTVQSPGVSRTLPDGTQEWVHHGGGHWWFTLPDGVTLPAGVGTLKDETGWGAAWSGRQVLVPPSVRKEGPYRLVGTPEPAPQFLLDRVFMAAEARAERERIRAERWDARKSGDLDLDPVDDWSASTPWATLLEADGWVATGLLDTCSCPTWTAPGGHASPKSATAHDLGCTRYDSEDGHAPLHVWTDNPPEYLLDAPRTLNRLTYVAYRDHQGSKHERESAAVTALGLAVHGVFDGGQEELDDFRAMLGAEPVQLEQIVSEANVPRATENGSDSATGSSAPLETRIDPFDTPASAITATPRPEEPAEVGEEPGPWFDWTDLSLIPPPRPLIEGVLDHRTMTIMAGKFGTYKTFLALDWAACVATGTPWAGHAVPEALPVVYVAAEGVGSFDRRLAAWGAGHEVAQRTKGALTIHGGPVNVMKNEAMSELVQTIKAKDAKLLVVDTFSRCAPGLEENEATKVAAALERLFAVRDILDIAVLVLHHTGHQGLRARGSSVLDDNADASWVIKLNGENNEDRGPDNPRTLEHRKSKDGELLGSKPMALVPAAGSAYLSFDPMDAPMPAGDRRAAESTAKDHELATDIREIFTKEGRVVGRETLAAMLDLPAGSKPLRRALMIAKDTWSKSPTDQRPEATS
jgi:hypothetical protein